MGSLERLPGVDDGNTTRRNATVTSLYILSGLAAIDVIRKRSESGGGERGEQGEQIEPTELSAVTQHTDWLQNSASFTGSGQAVTDTFGAVRFTSFIFDYDGSNSFELALIDAETGDAKAVLVDEDGPVSGAVGIGLPSGQYALDIDADGDWAIELGEPAAPEGGRDTPPATITSEGSNVFGKIILNDRVTIGGRHEGESEFIVSVWEEANTEATPDEIIFEEVGEFEDETSMERPGLFYIAVEADGPYHLEIS